MGTQTVILVEAGAGDSKLGRAVWGLRRAEAGARTDECATESRHAFLQGKEGCARREREERGVISKAGIESRIQSPGQRMQAAGSPGCRCGGKAAQQAPAEVPGFLQGLVRWGLGPGV